jgi:hypothetical protein
MIDHHHQFERDQEQADRHAGAERNVDDVPRFALQRGKRGAGVGIRVHADAVPGDPVRTDHADDREEQHECGGLKRLVLQLQKVVGHRRRDEQEEHDEKLALLNKVGSASLVDNLRYLEHRLMRGEHGDLAAEIKADTKRAADHERTV